MVLRYATSRGFQYVFLYFDPMSLGDDQVGHKVKVRVKQFEERVNGGFPDNQVFENQLLGHACFRGQANVQVKERFDPSAVIQNIRLGACHGTQTVDAVGRHIFAGLYPIGVVVDV